MVFHRFNLHFPDDIYDAEHIFMQLFEICISSLAKCLFRSLVEATSPHYWTAREFPFGSLKKKKIDLFLTVLGLCCCAQAFCSSGKSELLFIVVCRLLILVASLVVEEGLCVHGLCSCGARA